MFQSLISPPSSATAMSRGVPVMAEDEGRNSTRFTPTTSAFGGNASTFSPVLTSQARVVPAAVPTRSRFASGLSATLRTAAVLLTTSSAGRQSLEIPDGSAAVFVAGGQPAAIGTESHGVYTTFLAGQVQ